MNSERKTAIIVGALYIIATTAYSFSVIILDPILESSDYLTKLSESRNIVIAGALLVLIDAIAVAGIAIVIYPVLKKYNDTLALAYVGARIAEGILFSVNAITILTLLTMSKEFVQISSPDASYYQITGSLLLAAGEWSFLIGFGLVFILSALILNFVLYQSKLVPGWLSAWGFVGAILIILYYSLQYFNIRQVDFLFFPIAVQEMVFAVWLIVKGFNSSSIASRSL